MSAIEYYEESYYDEEEYGDEVVTLNPQQPVSGISGFDIGSSCLPTPNVK